MYCTPTQKANIKMGIDILNIKDYIQYIQVYLFHWMMFTGFYHFVY